MMDPVPAKGGRALRVYIQRDIPEDHISHFEANVKVSRPSPLFGASPTPFLMALRAVQRGHRSALVSGVT